MGWAVFPPCYLPGARQWQPTPVLLPGKSHGRRSLEAAVHGVPKSQTRLSDFTFTFHFHALEKEMATYSGVLAWRIPGMAEPGGLLSMGSHRVGHDWRDLAAAAAIIFLFVIFMESMQYRTEILILRVSVFHQVKILLKIFFSCHS